LFGAEKRAIIPVIIRIEKITAPINIKFSFKGDIVLGLMTTCFEEQ
jgi:hypothetical protein